MHWIIFYLIWTALTRDVILIGCAIVSVLLVADLDFILPYHWRRSKGKPRRKQEKTGPNQRIGPKENFN
jgi:hypothetical protein